MKRTYRKYGSWVQCWDDAVAFNLLAAKTFGVPFNPEIKEHKKGEPFYGYDIQWGVCESAYPKITPKAIAEMCEQLEYGHHITDSIQAKQVKETA